MPQTERADEAAAAAIVARELAVTLTFFDTLGSVDYVFEINGRPGALEVSRYTETAAKRAWYEWVRHDDESPHLAPQLRRSWLVNVDRATQFGGLAQRLIPALATLERLNITEYEQLDADWWAARPTLTEAVAILEDALVVHAEARDDINGPTQVLFLTSATKTAHGPGPAAHAIELYVAATPDNLHKLAASSGAHRHLWLWVDQQSAGIVEIPLRSAARPEFPITLPDEVTELWICHESTLHGWRYSTAQGWTDFGPPAS